MPDPAAPISWYHYLVGLGGGVTTILVLPALKWVGLKIVTIFKKGLAAQDQPQQIVQVVMPPGLGMPQQPQQQQQQQQPAPPPPPAAPPPAPPPQPSQPNIATGGPAHAFGADTPPRDRDSFVDVLAQLSREREHRQPRQPTEPVTWREHQALLGRFERSEKAQQVFRDTILQRTARICERLQIQIEEEHLHERDEDSGS